MFKDFSVYDIELVYNEIYIVGDNDGYTNFDINIEVTSRSVTAKIPNSVLPGERIRLKGLGKVKQDGSYGDVYVSFNNIYYNDGKFNSNSKQHNVCKKYEYKVIDLISEFEIEDEANEYAEMGYRLIDIIRCNGSFSLVFEREV